MSKNTAARISTVLYFIVLIISIFINAVDGDYFPIYIVLCVLSLVMTISGNKKYKIVGTVLLIFAFYLTITDYQKGNEHNYKMYNKNNSKT